MFHGNKQTKKDVIRLSSFMVLTFAFFYWFNNYFNVTTTIVINGPKKEEVSVIQEVKAQENDFIKVKVSHYWPDLGGVNCYTFVNGKCISKMANGQSWEKWVGLAIACPKELAFGTKLYLPDLDRTFTCMDRGSAIVKTVNDEYWIDMLIPESLVPYGKVMEAEVLK